MSEPLNIGLDLDKHFLPSWAQGSADPNKYSRFEGNEDAGGDRRGDRRDRPPRRDGGFSRPGGPRSGPGGGGGGGRPFGGPGGPGGGDRRGPRPGGGDRRPSFSGQGAGDLRWERRDGDDRRDRFGRRSEPRDPLPMIDVDLRPEPSGVASLARQIKLSGRAYPLFEVAGLVVQKPDRYEITFRTVKNKEGVAAQPLFECSLDNSVWLSEAEASKHVLTAHFDTFYATKKLPADAPKGVWTLVAQCGMTGEILGPPNYHGYQERLRKIHAERFGRMPFETYKARVKFVKDEAVVKQWQESVSFRHEYTTLNVPEEKTLNSIEEVHSHFNDVHRTNVIRSVDVFVLHQQEGHPKLPGPLFTLMRMAVDKERKFPIKTATALSSNFAHAGLQFFKRDKVVVHVAVARPHFLDLELTPVRDGIRKIVEFINSHPKTTRKSLMEALAPNPPPAPIEIPAPTDAPAATPAPIEAAAPSTPPLTPEQTAVASDLHWLIHQGHVIEFANGVLETAKKPVEKPPQAPSAPKEPREPKGPRGGGRGLVPVLNPSLLLLGE